MDYTDIDSYKKIFLLGPVPSPINSSTTFAKVIDPKKRMPVYYPA